MSKARREGFGALQVLLALVGVAAVTAAAVPRYQDFVVRSKMSEAFAIVTDTRNKLTEFYIMKNRFPLTDNELETMRNPMFSPPEFIEKVAVKGASEEHEVMIQVYFQRDVIPGDGFNEQYLYVGANSGSRTGALVEWTCGLQGIEEKYMPGRCLQ